MSSIKPNQTPLLTNFQKVRVFNKAFDVLPKTSIFLIPRTFIFTEDPNAVKLRLDLIKEEIDELKDAFNENNMIETRDAIADILYVVYGMADVFGIDIDNDIRNGYKVASNDTSSIFNIIKTHDTNGTLTDTSESLLNKIIDLFISINFSCSQRHFNSVSKNLLSLLENVYLLALVLGIDADADFDIVHSSNMSKLCSSEAEAKLTVADYEIRYRSGSSPYDTPYYYYVPDCDKWIVKNRSSSKVLKNINYIKVDFTK